MKLDRLIENEKLTLDMTPLIDVVFLLVLFFAVSTSFISPEDLKQLKKSFAIILQDKTSLELELETAKNAFLLEQQALKTSLVQNTKVITQKNEKFDRQKDQLNVSNTLNEKLIATLETQRNLSDEQKKLIFEQKAQAHDLDQKAQLLRERIILDENEHEEAILDLQELLSSAKKESELNLTLSRNYINDLEQQLASATKEANNFRKIIDLDKLKLKQLESTVQQLDSGLKDLVANEELGVKQVQNRIIIHLPDNVLFDSGSATIKKAGLRILQKVGRLLTSKMSGFSIQVGGHTDNVPLSQNKSKLFQDNWALSSARAVNVVRFFENEVGVPADKMSAVGYGYHQPIAKNVTAAGRKMNRRIEIVIVPNS